MPARPDDPPAVDSEDEGEGLEYMLGFVEPPEKATDLLRHRFPSKVGGAPAWLDPLNLPTHQQLTCDVTGQLMRFLLQVYCPADANPVEAFHRAVFLFVSPKGSDLSKPGSVKALRCQLPRSNPFYADTPAPATQLAPTPLPPSEHQLALSRDPWRVVEHEQHHEHHKQQQGNAEKHKEQGAGAAAAGSGGSSSSSGGGGRNVGGDGGGDGGVPGPAVFEEQELLVELEPNDAELGEGTSAEDQEVQRLLSSYHARVSAEGEYDDQELPTSLVDELEGAAGPDRQAFAAFQARCARAPEQVLRYCFQPGAAPLWPSPANQPALSDIPPCPHCISPRQFEFQVMPQLLSFMGLDVEDPHAPDWGTIVVYSCPRSCSAPPVQGPDGHSSYIEEFVWVQPS